MAQLQRFLRTATLRANHARAHHARAASIISNRQKSIFSSLFGGKEEQKKEKTDEPVPVQEGLAKHADESSYAETQNAAEFEVTEALSYDEYEPFLDCFMPPCDTWPALGLSQTCHAQRQRKSPQLS